MSQAWVFRKDDYDKILHKIKVLTERVEALEKSAGEGAVKPETRIAALVPETVAAK